MNILLVEDDYESRACLADFMRGLGNKVVESADGYDALELFSRGNYHLVLTDIKMPKISGIELLHKIRGLPRGRDVFIIVFTGYGDMQTSIEALRAGAYDYLLKPINLEELEKVIEQVAEHQALKQENEILTNKFDDVVKAATEETRQELTRLKRAYCKSVGLGSIAIYSEAMKMIFQQAARFHADRSIPVLIEGETGTGKEVIARYIHYGRGDVTTPFVDLNCAAIMPSLFESELFGYEAGAFTGGISKGQKGKLDMARGGTLFLDEIAEIPGFLQAKLLRFIQEKEYYRVGGLKKIKADVRILCATNVNIEEKVKEGVFRQDLYYRLNIGRILLPPLRNRTEEIMPLATIFLKEFSQKRGKRFSKISDPAAGKLLSYGWLGNVRELRNAMEWVTIMHDDVLLKPSHLGILETHHQNKIISENNTPSPAVDPDNFSLPPEGLDLENFLNKIICRVVEMHSSNKTRAAQYLNISRRSLQCRLEKIQKDKSHSGA